MRRRMAASPTVANTHVTLTIRLPLLPFLVENHRRDPRIFGNRLQACPRALRLPGGQASPDVGVNRPLRRKLPRPVQ